VGKQKPKINMPTHGVFGVNAKNLITATKTMDSFQHSALGTGIGGHRTLNLNDPVISIYLQ
jgi:hypothetical protein